MSPSISYFPVEVAALRQACQPFPVVYQLSIRSIIPDIIGIRPGASGGPGSIPGTTRKKVVVLEWVPLSLVSTTEELLYRKVAAPVYKTENTAVGIRHAYHVAPFIRESWQSFRRHAAVAQSV
jgi:hypothetical protein